MLKLWVTLCREQEKGWLPEWYKLVMILHAGKNKYEKLTVDLKRAFVVILWCDSMDLCSSLRFGLCRCCETKQCAFMCSCATSIIQLLGLNKTLNNLWYKVNDSVVLNIWQLFSLLQIRKQCIEIMYSFILFAL